MQQSLKISHATALLHSVNASNLSDSVMFDQLCHNHVYKKNYTILSHCNHENSLPLYLLSAHVVFSQIILAA